MGRLSTKIIAAIGAIWLIYMIGDVWYGAREARTIALEEVRRWSVVSGETVRVALNTLMREGKMDARFEMFKGMSEEITGLEAVRVIRGPRVDEIFRTLREQRDIPRLEALIRSYQEDIEVLRAGLPGVADEDERAGYRDAIDELGYDIRQATIDLERLRQVHPADAREQPQDRIDRQVLETGIAIFHVEEDRARMVAPYQVRKSGCSETSGCHVGAKEGEVLGAISMEFSLQAIESEIRRNAVLMAIGKFLVGCVILGFIYLAIDRIVIKNVNRIRGAIGKLGEGDFSARLHDPTRKSALATRLTATDDELGDLMRGFNAMAERLQRNQAKLEELATRDSLTGLYNRRKFGNLLGQELIRHERYHHPVSLLMIDLDHFKKINDTYGHSVGDDALRVACSVVDRVKRSGDILARYGGEELAVILPETPAENAFALAERIRHALADQRIMLAPDTTLALTASIGVATLPDNAKTAGDLIDAADQAMYAAKAAGRNCVRSAGSDQIVLGL